MEGAKATAFFRKPKKKKVNDELDRIKQAEKKKRRLEKLLATSAAIRSELEKKKLRNKEEQERLDEEGAAIAEAVALHVLIGEDSDDIDKIMMNKDRGLPSWDRSGNMRAVLGTSQPNFIVPTYCSSSKYSRQNVGLTASDDAYRRNWQPWNRRENSNSLVRANFQASKDLHPGHLGRENWASSFLSADHIAAQCVSSLSIADDARRDACLFNRVLRG